MRAEIITSGTELLLGEIADTNTSFLASQLSQLGIDLYHASLVGDNFERYSSVLKQAWERADIIFTTGGLGPTKGDISREVVAGLLGEEMTVRPELKEILESFFKGRGFPMPDNNLKQATLIPSAVALKNRAGTAPGWWVEKDGKIIVLMPGPPIELQDMWYQEVLPRLRAKSGAVILSRTLKTFGLSEGRVDELMTPFLSASNPTLGIYARNDGIQLRITAKAATEAEARELLAAREKELREVFGENVWGADEDTLEGFIGRQMEAAGKTLAVIETFTCGQLTQLLAAAPGSANFFRGGVVRPLAASEACEKRACELAEDVKQQFGADIVLSVDGYCLPEGNVMKTASFIVVDTGGSRETRSFNFPGRPKQYIRRTVTFALNYLRDLLISKPS